MATDRDDIADVTPTVTLAKLYEGQGLLDKAAAVYRKLVALEPNRTELDEALRGIERRLEGQRRQPGKSEKKRALYRLRQWQGAISGRKRGLDQRHEKKTRILVIHGQNPDMPGPRDTPSSNDVTLEQTDKDIKDAAEACGICVDIFQSSREGELVQKICEASDSYDAVIINPGEHTRTSMAIRDALSKLEIPIIEVHLSNIFGLELSGEKSLISDVVTAHLAGFGKEGYSMAVRAARNMTLELCGSEGSARDTIVIREKEVAK